MIQIKKIQTFPEIFPPLDVLNLCRQHRDQPTAHQPSAYQPGAIQFLARKAHCR
jgi:hypothetical protein